MDLKALKKPLKVYKRPGAKGRTYEYIKSRDVMDRMNTVFNGRWSSKIVSSEVVDNYLIIGVEVTVYDGDDLTFTHAGYGGVPMNNSDIAGRYKAALSLAVRNACARWGISGGEEEDTDVNESSFNPPFNPPSNPPSNTINGTVLPSTSLPTNIPPASSHPTDDDVIIPYNNIPTNTDTQSSTPPYSDSTISLPPQNVGTEPPSDIQIGGGTMVNTPTMVNNIPVDVPLPTVSNENSQSNPGASSNNETRMINIVQKQSINSILTIRNITYHDLVKGAFESIGSTMDPLPEMEALTHEQAITVIKYGNSITTK